MVEGSVPKIPPTLVPYRSATMVTKITTSDAVSKGVIICHMRGDTKADKQIL